MKKTIKGLLMMIMVSFVAVSLAACGGSKSKKDSSNDKAKTTKVSKNKKVKHIKKNTNAATVTVKGKKK